MRTDKKGSTVSFSLDGFSHPRYYEMYRSIESAYDPELDGIFRRPAYLFAQHSRFNGFLACLEPVTAYDDDLTTFCGPLSTVTNRHRLPPRCIASPRGDGRPGMHRL